MLDTDDNIPSANSKASASHRISRLVPSTLTRYRRTVNRQAKVVSAQERWATAHPLPAAVEADLGAVKVEAALLVEVAHQWVQTVLWAEWAEA